MLISEPFNEMCSLAQAKFIRMTKAHALFHLLFLILGVSELFFFLSSFALFSKSLFLAIFLATLFLTSFAYFVLLFYFQAKKPEQFNEIKHWYLDQYQERHQHIKAKAALHFAKSLENQEYNYYLFSFFPKSLDPSFQKLSCMWHWKDVLQMREILLCESIQEYIKWIKFQPDDLETHAALGEAYLELGSLYQEREKKENWTPRKSADTVKFRASMERAIEEFKIIEHFLPDDLWVHSKLAMIYHHLKMRDKEIEEYETIHRFAPEDLNTLLRLGILYFEQGHSVKGLKIYQQLKESNAHLAEELIAHYDAYAHPLFQEMSN